VVGLGRYPCSRLQPGDTIKKSQDPDDGCINVRNILNIGEEK